MSTNSVFDWSDVAGSNIDVAGNGIAGSSNISLGNDVFQNIMAQIAAGLIERGSDIATASTISFTGATTRALTHDLTGTTTVTAVTLTAGHWRICRAQGAFQLTASSTLVVNGSTSTNDTTNAGDLVVFFGYSSSTVRVWRIPGGGASQATTSAYGTVKLATLAQTLAPPAGSTLVPTIGNLYFPTGHLYGLTLTNSGSDATNDIVIAAGTARDASDSYNYILASALTKQLDASWAVGTNAGGLDTGSVGNNRYAIWGIGRSDTGVTDALFSLSFSAPTMPTSYDYKVLIGEVTRSGAANGTPLWYGPRRASTGYTGITLGTPATASSTSVDFTSIPSWAKRVTLNLNAVSTNNTSLMQVQIGTSGGIQTSSYVGACSQIAGTTVTNSYTSGLVFQSTGSASASLVGKVVLDLMDPTTGVWLMTGTTVDAANTNLNAAVKNLAGVLDRVRLTTVGGTASFDAGTVNISWE